ncbi:LacI family DNA-binding transcriptional regulator [Thalassotalea fonticola]|uniref:LacI family DNA-binding transcriptional regulator n=1 Tax=Thalassotalea fonticola TaxID=3065649 RepID=A0ABZ0GJY4_9GAMM|nr:LacI family DNA-binding transcriptional regulator [Colwelliaceae bacterium S1-1]
MSSVKAVAKEAGVSTATVSRFLNTPELLTEKTRIKVTAAIKATGYSMNSLARNFRRGKSNTIVVVMPSIGVPHFGSVMKGIETVASEKGFSIMIIDTQFNTLPADKMAGMFFSNQADGIILLGSSSPFKHALSHASSPEKHPPIIVSCENATPEIIDFPSVRIDNRAASIAATNHLISLGHIRVAFISGSLSTGVSGERESGYRLAMNEHNLDTCEDLISDGNLTIEDGRRLTRRLLNQNQRPTAILCANDEMALGAIYEIKNYGLKVPEDVSVIGFDDIRYAEISDPPLTTIAQPGEEIGEKTMYQLCNVIEGSKIDSTPVIVPHQLIIRSSTAAPQTK